MFADVVDDGSCAPALLSRLMSSREEREDVDVPRSDHAEMPSVDRRDLGEAEAFGDGHDGGVDGTQRQVGVAEDEFGGPAPVPGFETDDGQVAVAQRSEECRYGSCACFSREQVAGFGDDGRRQSEDVTTQVGGGEQVHAGAMVAITSQDGCDDWASVDQDHAGRRPRPSARISSTRSDTSDADPSATANQAGGHGRSWPTAVSLALRSETAAGTCSSGSCSTSSRNSSRGVLTW